MGFVGPGSGEGSGTGVGGGGVGSGSGGGGCGIGMTQTLRSPHRNVHCQVRYRGRSCSVSSLRRAKSAGVDCAAPARRSLPPATGHCGHDPFQVDRARFRPSTQSTLLFDAVIPGRDYAAASFFYRLSYGSHCSAGWWPHDGPRLSCHRWVDAAVVPFLEGVRRGFHFASWEETAELRRSLVAGTLHSAQ
jgi:hypothetical protein